jgi:hypothetical protein
MTKMRVRTFYGEIMEIPIDEEGRYRCPVCGDNWDDVPPYSANGQTDFDICPSCHTAYGLDDCEHKAHPGEPLAQRIARLRTRWLDGKGWSQSALDQVEQWLGLGREELEKQKASLGDATRLD